MSSLDKPSRIPQGLTSASLVVLHKLDASISGAASGLGVSSQALVSLRYLGLAEKTGQVWVVTDKGREVIAALRALEAPNE